MQWLLSPRFLLLFVKADTTRWYVYNGVAATVTFFLCRFVAFRCVVRLARRLVPVHNCVDLIHLLRMCGCVRGCTFALQGCPSVCFHGPCGVAVVGTVPLLPSTRHLAGHCHCSVPHHPVRVALWAEPVLVRQSGGPPSTEHHTPAARRRAPKVTHDPTPCPPYHRQPCTAATHSGTKTKHVVTRHLRWSAQRPASPPRGAVARQGGVERCMIMVWLRAIAVGHPETMSVLPTQLCCRSAALRERYPLRRNVPHGRVFCVTRSCELRLHKRGGGVGEQTLVLRHTAVPYGKEGVWFVSWKLRA